MEEEECATCEMTLYYIMALAMDISTLEISEQSVAVTIAASRVCMGLQCPTQARSVSLAPYSTFATFTNPPSS